MIDKCINKNATIVICLAFINWFAALTKHFEVITLYNTPECLTSNLNQFTILLNIFVQSQTFTLQSVA